MQSDLGRLELKEAMMKSKRESRNVRKTKSQLKSKPLGKTRTLALAMNHNLTLVRVS